MGWRLRETMNPGRRQPTAFTASKTPAPHWPAHGLECAGRRGDVGAEVAEVAAAGFYEWQKGAKDKQPFYIYRNDEEPLAFAGL